MSILLPRRFWVEAFLGSCSGLLAIGTVFRRDWIEIVFGADPDRRSGSIEWLIVAFLVVTTIALAVGARLEWRRAQHVEA
jgi:uncharacterized membrane protein